MVISACFIGCSHRDLGFINQRLSALRLWHLVVIAALGILYFAGGAWFVWRDHRRVQQVIYQHVAARTCPGRHRRGPACRHFFRFPCQAAQAPHQKWPRQGLVRKWTSRLAQQGACIRTSLCLASDGSALIDTTVSKGAESRKFSTQARWQLQDNETLQLWGTQTATWKILTLNSWTMITADQARAGFPVRWTTHPRINVKPWLLLAAAVLLPVLVALSLQNFITRLYQPFKFGHKELDSALSETNKPTTQSFPIALRRGLARLIYGVAYKQRHATLHVARRASGEFWNTVPQFFVPRVGSEFHL